MQKTLIVLIVGILAVGCLTSEQKQKALRDSVVGEYEQVAKDTHKLFLIENGKAELQVNGEKPHVGGWSIVNKGNPLIINGITMEGNINGITMEGKLASHIINVHHSGRLFYIYRINSDKSISQLGNINNEHWSRYGEPLPTMKKIK